MKNLRKKVQELCKKNKLFRKFVRLTRNSIKKVMYSIYMLRYRTKENFVFFEAFKGKSYADSPKALYEEMLREEKYQDFTYIWAFKDVDTCEIRDDENTLVVTSNTSDYYKYFSMSKYIITNSRLAEHMIIKKRQVYVQTWHGTPLKRLGCDIEVEYKNPYNTVEEVKKKYESEGKKMTYLISPSKFTSEKLSSAFNLKKLNKEDIIIEEGYPRNDALFSYTDEDKERIKEELKIPKGKKVILYAPTFRDNSHQADVGYTYYPEVDFEMLRTKLGEEYVVLYRAHYFVAQTFEFDKYVDFIYNMSNIGDINKLYIISDILITDYSSVFFDYANLNKPILFFMYDLDYYQNEARGFYIDLNELPGPITQTEEELIYNIQNIQEVQRNYEQRYNNFNKKFNYLEEGQASKRVIERIL